jgi:hypothetical protein
VPKFAALHPKRCCSSGLSVVVPSAGLIAGVDAAVVVVADAASAVVKIA